LHNQPTNRSFLNRTNQRTHSRRIDGAADDEGVVGAERAGRAEQEGVEGGGGTQPQASVGGVGVGVGVTPVTAAVLGAVDQT